MHSIVILVVRVYAKTGMSMRHKCNSLEKVFNSVKLSFCLRNWSRLGNYVSVSLVAILDAISS